ncbi:MAG: GNAT family N-acetyltransferase [Thermodesulfobacteriota bacterium]|jgi:RimJ/RimL family protein N-acetyltransferase
MTSRFQNFFKWSSAVLRYNGPMVLLWRLLQKGVSRFGRLEMVTLFEKDLSQPLKDAKKLADLTITLATESDIEPLVKLIGERFKTQESSRIKEFEDLIHQRFKKGSFCFLGKIGKEIVHYAWISFHWGESLGGHFIHLKDDEALLLDAFTLEKWRGQGILPAVVDQMIYYLQQHGYLKFYVLVDTDNKSSKKTFQRLGWLPLGIVFSFTPRGASKGWILPLKRKLAYLLKYYIPNST